VICSRQGLVEVVLARAVRELALFSKRTREMQQQPCAQQTYALQSIRGRSASLSYRGPPLVGGS
jgi:hypothetical protein